MGIDLLLQGSGRTDATENQEILFVVFGKLRCGTLPACCRVLLRRSISATAAFHSPFQFCRCFRVLLRGLFEWHHQEKLGSAKLDFQVAASFRLFRVLASQKQT